MVIFNFLCSISRRRRDSGEHNYVLVCFVLWELNSVVIWYRVVKQVCAFFILQLSLTPCAEQILNCAEEVGD